MPMQSQNPKVRCSRSSPTNCHPASAPPTDGDPCAGSSLPKTLSSAWNQRLSWQNSRVTTNRSRIFQLFKYAIYAFLALNVYWFFIEEFAAAIIRFPEGISLGQIIAAYAATIDTASWVVLLLMFELETYVLDEHHFTNPVTWTLQGVRERQQFVRIGGPVVVCDRLRRIRCDY